MLAARDQENLVHGHQQAAASKPLNHTIRGIPPKTPGNKYPKTPLKISLNDENEPAGFGGGKSVLGTKGKGLENLAIGGKNGATFDKNAFITPMGPRNRAPLGMKTTNAKTKAFQTPAAPILDKDPVKTQTKPTSARRPKSKVSHAETIKLNIHGDESGPLEEREPEYCPPKPTPLPYESDVFPDGCLDYDILKRPNLMRGWQNYYRNPVDENGISLKEKRFEAECAKAHKDAEEKILKQMEEMEWTIGDVPETFKNLHINDGDDQGKDMINKQVNKSSVPPSKGPATVASRKAASALSVAPKAPLTAAKLSSGATTSKKGTSFLACGKKPAAPVPVNPSAMRHTAAAVVSRSTIGYTKGRSASSVLKMRAEGLPRSTSNLSTGSDTTITPLYAQKQGPEVGNEDWRRLMFSGMFDTDEEDLEPGLRGALPDCLRRDEDAEVEFIMTLPGV